MGNEILVQKNESSRAKIYSRYKLVLSLLDLAVSLSGITLLAFTDLSRRVLTLVIPYSDNVYVQFLLFLALIGAGFTVLTLPFDFISSYVLEHRYTLSNQTVFSWSLEHVKSLLIALSLGVPLATAFYYLINTTGSLWWLYFGGVVYFTAVVLARVAPVIIFPLFYRFTPLPEGPLKETITGLLSHYNIHISGIFSFNMSKDTRRANAGFTGIGRSRRIILSDTLLNEFSDDEITVIVAHEMGHYVGRHLLKNLLHNGIIIFVSLFLCSTVYDVTLAARGFTGPSDIAATPLLLFYLSLFSLILMPALNGLSRRYEREADRYALNATGRKDSFISAMEKLASLNLADRDPHPLVELLFYGHPSISKRISFARTYKVQ